MDNVKPKLKKGQDARVMLVKQAIVDLTISIYPLFIKIFLNHNLNHGSRI